MNRRKFLSLISGAVAAVAGGLGLVKRSPSGPLFDAKAGDVLTFGAGKPYGKTVLLTRAEPPLVHEDWPATYHLMVQLPQPKNRPITLASTEFGIPYFIERPAVTVECRHVGDGFYVGEHLGMRLLAIAERRDGKLFCAHAAWEGEFNV